MTSKQKIEAVAAIVTPDAVEQPRKRVKRTRVAFAMDPDTRAALAKVIASAGAANVLMYVGQVVNRRSIDPEEGFVFQRKAIRLARRAPAIEG
jgi:hypothetical protein